MIELASWSAGGRSERGSRHESAGEPNQDAIAVAQSPVAIVAVADGHGSARCPRSDIGAAVAVAVARELLPAFVRDSRDLATLRTAVADALVGSWNERVIAHLAAHPLAATDVAAIEGPPLHAYGATLVAVAAYADTLLAVQIGDGDAWLVADDGTRRLIPRDLRYAFNGTASLCMDRAANEVRVARVRAEGSALAIAATDGYGRMLVTDNDFAASCRALYDRVQTLGLAAVLDALPLDLAGASADGGDDVTVGILSRA